MVKSIDFGFVFARFVRFYGMSDQQVMDMPARRFWWMDRCINRLQAAEDMRHISLAAAVNQGGDSLKNRVDHLKEELGTIAVVVKSNIEKTAPEAKRKLLRLMD